ncbi:MAG: tRNA pseudouridine(13) synthase TruD [Tepidisphaeraceae bacterium]|jgi:tRNA pseudouridine13 synthase
MDLPYLTDFPGIGGVIKDRPEDFCVQEVPLYEPCGEGEHVFCEIQKTGLTTFDAVDRMGRALNISPRDIGFAGMKDARAVTRQSLSIPGVTEEQVMAAAVPGIQILWAKRHGNKLRLGHLKGNRFAIKVRQVNAEAVVKVKPVLEELERRGMPNYFGEQRFGLRKNNHQLGAALVAGDDKRLLDLLLGQPDQSVDDAQSLGARKAYDGGDMERSMHLWPRRCGMERRVLHRLMKTGKAGVAAKCVDERLRRLWVSALQSEMFNQVLARRIGEVDRVQSGDWAMKHENGACFLVEDGEKEQPRAAAWEISPTGPIVGYRMSLCEGRPGEIESEVLSAAGLSPESFRIEGRLRVKGTRRALRVRPENVEISGGADEFGPFISVVFTLPSGSFATVLMREVMRAADDEE